MPEIAQSFGPRVRRQCLVGSLELFHGFGIARSGNEGRARSLPLALSKEGKTMKPLMPAALLIALSTVALAKPNPIELTTVLVDAGVMNMGSGGSVQENTGSIGGYARARIL